MDKRKGFRSVIIPQTKGDYIAMIAVIIILLIGLCIILGVI